MLRNGLIVVLFLATVASQCFAQTQNNFKKEVLEFFEVYDQCLNTIGNSESTKEERNKHKKALRDWVDSPSILVVNDMDKSASWSKMKLGAYLKYLESDFAHGYKQAFNLKALEFKDVFVDDERNCYRITATVKKRAEIPVIENSLQDSTAGDSIISYDKHFSKLVFYFKTTKMYEKFTPLKLEAVQVYGKKPVYRNDIPDIEKWWLTLDPDWKKIVTDNVKMPEVATEYHLKRIQTIKKVSLSGVKSPDLTPLEKFKGLESLDLSETGLDTLLVLEKANLTRLKTLNLSRNELTSLHGLEAYTALENLSAHDNEIVDISHLKNCTNLYYLGVKGNNIEDISVVKNFPHITTLNVGSNFIKDLNALKGTVSLKKLDISKNKDIESLEPIANCLGMGKLDIYNTKIGSLRVLRRMTSIHHLDMGYIKVNSLDDIRNLPNLAHLNISGNVITDFSALNNFRKLRKFYCNSTKISDISPLMKMQFIKEMSATHTNFSKADIQRFKKKYPKCSITYY